jgi:hypothetical protein
MPGRIDRGRLDVESGRMSIGIVGLLLAAGHVVEFLGLGQIGPDCREPLVVGRREFLAGLGPSGIRPRELGVERDGLAEVGDGRLIGLVREIGLTAGGVGVGRLRVEPDRLAQGCDRLFGILLLEPEEAPLQAGTGQLRRRGDGGLDVSHRPISVTADGRQQRLGRTTPRGAWGQVRAPWRRRRQPWRPPCPPWQCGRLPVARRR